MSDTINTTDNVTTTPAKTKASRKPVPFSALHVKFAQSKGIDVTRAAKLNRSYIRANFDVIAKQWPELRKSQKDNRDGNRYPATVPASLADAIVKRSVKGAKR